MKHSTLLLALCALSACSDDAASPVDAAVVPPDAAVVPPDAARVPIDVTSRLSRDIDILFVIDDSGSMRQEQESLANGFPRFIEVLQGIEGGLPNIHLGVISSNVGTGPVGGGGDACAGNGDNGQLLVRDGCPALTDGSRFIEDVVVDDANGTRSFNYTGDLASQFSCMAQLGTSGCGFEQHLESMKRALEPGNPTSAGFVRDDAFLAVVFLQDEDDCSTTTEGREMFDPSQDDREAPLGELSSFRCFEFGTTCQPADERSLGPRDDCVPGDDDTDYMASVDGYLEFIKGLKSDPVQVMAAAITGDRENADGVVVVGEHPERVPPELWLEPACVVCPDGASTGCPLSPVEPDGALVDAAPAIRMRAFLDGFPQRSTWQNICSYDPVSDAVDLSAALTRIASLIARSLGSFCLDGDLATPLDCQVFEVGADQQETLVPSCSDGDPPCWVAFESAFLCPDGNTVLEIDRGDSPPPEDSTVSVRCVVD